MNIFPPHATDFYKTGHYAQYPAGTQYVYSNFTCRSDRWAEWIIAPGQPVVFFGLQGVCQWLLIDEWNRGFFEQPKDHVVAKYKRRMDSSLGIGSVSTDHIAALHDLKYLPLLIKALPEGSLVDLRVPLWTIINTHPDFYWLTNYVETQLSAECWKTLTSATIACEYRRILSRFTDLTGADPLFIDWQGHDFSARGMSGIHDAAQCGAGHLLSFTGTDTISAIDYLEDYYLAGDTFIGGSVPATEHSVMCAGGADCEIDTFRNLITSTYPKGVVSIVSDTWDLWTVLTEFTVTLKDEILAREGKVVFRPDSGDPVKIILGDPDAPEGTPTWKGAVRCLWEVFGGTLTSKGYKTLDSHVGLIYGDSISLARAQAILEGLEALGFSSANIVFGIGSYTYQHVTRDTFGTAIKATWAVVDGVARELFKDPATDNGVKKSARGLLRVEYENGHFVLYDRQTENQETEGLLRPIFCDGEMVTKESLAFIRDRLKHEVKEQASMTTAAATSHQSEALLGRG